MYDDIANKEFTFLFQRAIYSGNPPKAVNLLALVGYFAAHPEQIPHILLMITDGQLKCTRAVEQSAIGTEQANTTTLKINNPFSSVQLCPIHPKYNQPEAANYIALIQWVFGAMILGSNLVGFKLLDAAGEPLDAMLYLNYAKQEHGMPASVREALHILSAISQHTPLMLADTKQRCQTHYKHTNILLWQLVALMNKYPDDSMAKFMYLAVANLPSAKYSLEGDNSLLEPYDELKGCLDRFDENCLTMIVNLMYHDRDSFFKAAKHGPQDRPSQLVKQYYVLVLGLFVPESWQPSLVEYSELATPMYHKPKRSARLASAHFTLNLSAETKDRRSGSLDSGIDV